MYTKRFTSCPTILSFEATLRDYLTRRTLHRVLTFKTQFGTKHLHNLDFDQRLSVPNKKNEVPFCFLRTSPSFFIIHFSGVHFASSNEDQMFTSTRESQVQQYLGLTNETVGPNGKWRSAKTN